jgi:hypothetical protein
MKYEIGEGIYECEDILPVSTGTPLPPRSLGMMELDGISGVGL